MNGPHEASETRGIDKTFRPKSLETKGALLQVARYWVQEYGGEGTNFTIEQEHRLAADVQAGLAAESIAQRAAMEQRDLEPVLAEIADEGERLLAELDSYDKLHPAQKKSIAATVKQYELADQLMTSEAAEQTMQELIERGQKAQTALVETNLRFAHYYARLSVGIHHNGSLIRLRKNGAEYAQNHPEIVGLKSGRAYSEGKSGYSGTYRPIGSSKSPYADLQDRQTYAAIGLIKAAKSFQPEPQSKTKFISFAAWSIQQEIDRSTHNEEHNGIRLPSDQHAVINAYFRNNSTISPDEPVPQEVQDLIRLTDFEEFPNKLKAHQEGSLEELNDPYGDDDKAEVFEEIYADQRKDTESIVTHRLAKEAIHGLLGSFSDLEAGVIALRFGIPWDDFKGGQGMTLEEIGNIFGFSAERIRQIESKTLAKLRHPQRSSILRDYGAMDRGDGLPTDFISRGDVVKVPEGAATYNGPQTHEMPISVLHAPFTEAQNRQREEKQAWQASIRDKWEDPVRRIPERSAEPVDPQLFKFIYETIDSVDSYHFQRSFIESVKTPYPVGLVQRIDSYCEGKRLTAGHIASIWTRFMRSGYVRLKHELGDDFSADRVGQFFSKLIEKHVASVEHNDDLLTLHIPTDASGEIGYLASGLRAGRIKIIGNPGNYAGALNGGFADVEIIGNVGDNAGVLMSDNAQLIIHGDAGRNLGDKIKDNAYIRANTALSIGEVPLSDDSYIHTQIRR